MSMKFWGRDKAPKVPDTAESLLPATQGEFDEASAAASALHGLIVKGRAQFPGFEASTDGRSAWLSKMPRASGLRDVLLTLSITQSDSGTWWVAQQQINRGTELEPNIVRKSTELPLAPSYGVVHRTEHSAETFVPFKSFTPDASQTTEVEGDPLVGNVCRGLTQQLKDIAATAILPEVVVA